MDHLEDALKQFYKSKGIDTEDALFGFHMPPFISVRHLHMHAIAPRSSMSWMNSFVFKTNSAWFKVVSSAERLTAYRLPKFCKTFFVYPEFKKQFNTYG